LLRRASVALITALGMEERWCVYEAPPTRTAPSGLSLMGDLREALDHNQLELHSSPSSTWPPA
jgi:hypothetical protein